MFIPQVLIEAKNAQAVGGGVDALDSNKIILNSC
jgi:hypothetical protein